MCMLVIYICKIWEKKVEIREKIRVMDAIFLVENSKNIRKYSYSLNEAKTYIYRMQNVD